MGDNTRRGRMYRSHGMSERPGDTVLAVEEGSARIYLRDRQQRAVGAGEVVRIPSEMPHTIESVGEVPLRGTTDG